MFALKKTRASGQNVGKVSNPVFIKLAIGKLTRLMPKSAEKPSLHSTHSSCNIFHLSDHLRVTEFPTAVLSKLPPHTVLIAVAAGQHSTLPWSLSFADGCQTLPIN